MTALDVAKLALITVTPTLIGAVLVFAPRWFGFVADHWPRRSDREPKPIGPPIEQLAVDLRRLLRLHSELTESAHMAMRAHRVWAVEAAIDVRAREAAKALDVPHRDPEPPASLNRIELSELLHALSAAGMVLPAKVGPFVGDGRY
ncbi:MAG TPA: hypothetical protein VFR35_15895 [Actinoplanes sp.]|nr:hypothetical protein [Actinoplanes sp.]